MKVLKFYRYRTGRIHGDATLTFERKLTKELENELYRIAGLRDVDRDNHVCFLVEMQTPWGKPVTKAWMFTDLVSYLGDYVEEKKW
jgi:hypothetical protein